MSKHAILGMTKCIALDYREFNIACSQIDIGKWDDSCCFVGLMKVQVTPRRNPIRVLRFYKRMERRSRNRGLSFATRQVLLIKNLRTYEVSYAGEAVAYMASLPLHVNVLNQV